MKAEEVVLLDVREQDEWQDGHVEGSLHVPFHALRDGVSSEVRRRAEQKPLAAARALQRCSTSGARPPSQGRG